MGMARPLNELIERTMAPESQERARSKARELPDFKTDEEAIEFLEENDLSEYLSSDNLKHISVAIQEGINSGVSTKNALDIKQDVENRLRKAGKL